LDDFLERREVVGEFSLGQRGTGAFRRHSSGIMDLPKVRDSRKTSTPWLLHEEATSLITSS
jgi:hypothetical protein